MIFNRERSDCYGRGFNAPGGGFKGGMLYYFKEWITRAPVVTPVPQSTGGPGWYIISDHSADATNPYIVVSDYPYATMKADPNAITSGPYKILKITAYTSISGYIYFEPYYYWDTDGDFGTPDTGKTLWQKLRVVTSDSGPFQYDFRGGPDLLSISTRIADNWYIYCIGDWIGDLNFVEGPSLISEIQNSITISTSPVVINLPVGHAANYTVGNWYYIYDARVNNSVEYVQVTDRDTGLDTITVNRITYNNYSTGSAICAYRHRFWGWGNNTPGYGRNAIPYCSYKNTNGGSNYTYATYGDNRLSANADYHAYLIDKLNPDDLGNYFSEAAILNENTNGANNSTDMNRALGVPVGIFFTKNVAMQRMVDGRTINSSPYIFADTTSGKVAASSGQAMLLPDWDAES